MRVKNTISIAEYQGLTLEKDFQRDLEAQLTAHGYLWFHQAPGPDSKRNTGASGFPDLVAVHPNGGHFVAELKRKRSRAKRYQPAIAQARWLDAYRAAGVETYVWTPDDWPAILAVLARLSRPLGLHLVTDHGPAWGPAS